jgi:hypothetical protein
MRLVEKLEIMGLSLIITLSFIVLVYRFEYITSFGNANEIIYVMVILAIMIPSFLIYLIISEPSPPHENKIKSN